MKFNYHIIILLLLIVRLFTPSTAKASQNYINNLYPSDNDEFETLMEKIRKDFAQNPLIDEFLQRLFHRRGLQPPRPYKLGTSHSHRPTV